MYALLKLKDKKYQLKLRNIFNKQILLKTVVQGSTQLYYQFFIKI